MVIYSCCDIKSVDAEGCCNADKHIGFTGFSAEQCPGHETGRQGHCANIVCEFHQRYDVPKSCKYETHG